MRPFSTKRYAALFAIDKNSASRSLESVLGFYGQAFMLDPHATLAEMTTGAQHLSYQTLASIYGCGRDRREDIDDWTAPRRYRFHRMFQAEPGATVRELVNATAPMPLEEIARRAAELEGRADRLAAEATSSPPKARTAALSATTSSSTNRCSVCAKARR